jgi:HEAT repeat protein
MKRIKSFFLITILTLIFTSYACLNKSVNTTNSINHESLDDLILLLGKFEKEAAPARERILAKGSKAIGALIEAMQKGKTGKIRAEAITLLGQLKAREAVPFLIDEIQNEKSIVRSFAIEAAGNIGDEKAISALASVLKKPGYKTRRSAIKSLIQIGKLGQDKLAEIMLKNCCDSNSDISHALKNSNWIPQNDREKYLLHIKLDDWGFLRVSGPESIKYLIEVLKCSNNKDSNIMEILAEKGCDECLSAVLEKLEKNSSYFDGYALSRFGEKAADRIYDRYKKTENSSLKEACFCALAKLKDDRIFDQAVELLKSDNGNCKYEAIQLFKSMDNKNTPKYLAPMLNKKEDYRNDILEILGKFKDPSSVPAIVEFIRGGGYENDIKKAIYILGDIKDIRAVDILYQYANHPLEELRKPAYTALLKLKIEQRPDILIKLMLADDLDVRQQAYKRLIKIKWKYRNDFEKAAECLVSQKYSRCAKNRHILTQMLQYDLESMNTDIKIQAFDGLLKIKDASSREFVTYQLKSKDFSDRHRAAKILQRLNWIPESAEDKVRFYLYSNQINECLKMGEKGVSLLIDYIIEAQNKGTTVKIIGLKEFLTSESSRWLPFLLEKYSTDYHLNNMFYKSFVLNTWEDRFNEIESYVSSDNKNISKAAINILAASYDPSATKYLIAQLGKNESHDDMIMIALKRYNLIANELMMEALDSPDQQKKNIIIDALLCNSDKNTIQKIKQLSSDNNTAIADAAKNWLQKCFTEQVIQKDELQKKQNSFEEPIVNQSSDFEIFTKKFFSEKIGTSDIQLLQKYSLKLLSLPDSRRRNYAAELLKKYNWSPSTWEEEVALNFAQQNWEELIRMGEDALPYLKYYYDNNIKESDEFLEILKLLGWKPEDLQNEIKAAIIMNDEKTLLNMKDDVIPFLITFFEQMKDDHNILFIIKMFGLKKDMRSVDTLLNTYNWNKSILLKVEANKALKLITGKKYRYQREWRSWWESEKKSANSNLTNQ